MPYEFPRIPLSDQELLWMKAVVSHFKKRETVNTRDLKIELYPKTGPGLKPRSIHLTLLRPDATTPTLLGLWHADENDPLIPLTDRLLSYIKGRIVAHNVADVVGENVAEDLKASKEDVWLCFELLLSLGYYFGGGQKLDQNKPGFSSITVSDEAVVDAYLDYVDLPTAVAVSVKRNAPPRIVQVLPESESSQAREEIQIDSAFILMSMDPGKRELDDVLDGIKEAFESFGISARRVDDIQDQYVITEAILEQIRRSEYVIADLTYERPNVYYEVGYAQAQRKKPILIAKEGTRIHFDLSVHNIVFYESVRDLREKLATRLGAITGRDPQ
ncbi:MAG: hypothetical protein JRN15_08365 [Nitrososphaerota archaeon]|nr:hypothetical protein [Nitrososphaerota archaeon]